MNQPRTHQAISADGTRIGARIHGDGPLLVLVHGGAGDGEHAWRFLLPMLTDRYTCVAMSTRGRGLSGDHPDHSIDALVGDVVAVAESMGDMVGVFGHSSSLTLAAAVQTTAIVGVAVHEPAVPMLPVSDQAQRAIERLVHAALDDRSVDAVRIFFEDSGLFDDDEIAVLVANGSYELMAPNVSSWVRELAEYGGAVDPAVLDRVEVPVLLLRGTRSPAWFRESVAYVAERLSDVRVRDVAGAGHMGPLVTPGGVAAELDDFFSSTSASRLTSTIPTPSNQEEQP